MNRHPSYYAELLQRRAGDHAPLSLQEEQELTLHLLICPACQFRHIEILREQDPARARELLGELWASLTTDLVTPHLRQLAKSRLAGRPLTGFQHLLWQYAQRDRETLGRYRLLEADEWLQARKPYRARG